MIKENHSTQQELELVYIENLVSKDHILRKIDKYMNFLFWNRLSARTICE